MAITPDPLDIRTRGPVVPIDPRVVEDSIVVRMNNVDVSMDAEVTPLRFDRYEGYIRSVIDRHLNQISIEIHELFPDAEVFTRSTTYPRKG